MSRAALVLIVFAISIRFSKEGHFLIETAKDNGEPGMDYNNEPGFDDVYNQYNDYHQPAKLATNSGTRGWTPEGKI